MLNNKQKTELKKLAHQSNKDLVKFNIGKGNIDSDVIDMINNALVKHELLKISFLKGSLQNAEKEEMILDLVSKLKVDLVQKIGNTIIIYKPNPKLENRIILKN